MSRTDRLHIVAWPLLAVGVDGLSKAWASAQVDTVTLGPVELALVRNHGFILGHLSSFPDEARLLSCSLLVAAVFFVVLFAHLLIPWRARSLRIGLNLAGAGILGNFSDRIVEGSVRDFIMIQTSLGSTPFFNLADVWQLVGLAIIAGYLIRYRDAIFFAREKRRGYWVNPRFQLRYCLTLVLAGLGMCVALVLFSTTYWGAVVGAIDGDSVESYLVPFLVIAACVSIALLAMLVAFGVILSHRIAGPLYALERFLVDRRSGGRGSFRLREADDFKKLEQIVNDLLE